MEVKQVMTKKRKVNPRRIPQNRVSIEKNAKKEAIDAAWAIFFTVLRDKEGYSQEQLKRVWNSITTISESISAGYVNVNDLKKTLEEEVGIFLK